MRASSHGNSSSGRGQHQGAIGFTGVSAAEDRAEKIHQRILQLRDEVRADLDAARKELPAEQYENYHRHTVDSHLREVHELLKSL